MNPSFLPTAAALLGTIIGGLTSFLTSWTTQTAQTRAQRIEAARTRRETLFGHFMDEMSRLYAHALSEDQIDYSKLVDIFALKGRIRLVASQPVIDIADRAVKHLIDLYIGPKLDAHQVRAMLDEVNSDYIGHFAEACRVELQAFEML
jgi:hypothetical protein